MKPQLNEWNLPHGVEPHNPDNLTPEQITEGGKYRPLAKSEVDEGYHEVLGSGYYSTGSQEWSHYDDEGGWVWGKYSTIRVPITTPLLAVKESLTPQPATGPSKTPRTDEESSLAYLFPSRCEVVHTYFARTLETELTAALAQRDEARETLDLMCDEFQRIKALAGLPLEAHTFCERAISGIKQRVPLVEQRDKAEKERDEARRLLGEARRVMQQIYDDTECYADGAPDASAYDRLCNDISGKLRQPLTQITNHLNK